MLAACQPGDLGTFITKMGRDSTEHFAHAFLDTVRAGRLEAAAAEIAPELRERLPGVADSLWRASAFLPGGAIDTIRVVGVNVFNTSSDSRSRFTYELHTPEGWGAVEVGVHEEGGLRYVDDFHTYRLQASLEELNAFTFRGKGPGHVLMLLITAACFASSVFVAYKVARSRLRRRWLWALVALVGVTVFRFDWSTGQVAFQLLSVQLFSASYVRASLAAPWIISASFPAGALLAWQKLRSATAAAMPGDEPSSATPPANVSAGA